MFVTQEELHMEHKSGTDFFMLTEEFIASTLLVSFPWGSFTNGYYSWLDGYVYCTHSCQKYYNNISGGTCKYKLWLGNTFKEKNK